MTPPFPQVAPPHSRNGQPTQVFLSFASPLLQVCLTSCPSPVSQATTAPSSTISHSFAAQQSQMEMCAFSYLDCLSKHVCFAASPLSFKKNNSSKKESDLASPMRLEKMHQNSGLTVESETLSTTEGHGLLLARMAPQAPGPLCSWEDNLDRQQPLKEAGLLLSTQSESVFIHLPSSRGEGKPRGQ